jgi:Domain of unknown function (DUF4148)
MNAKTLLSTTVALAFTAFAATAAVAAPLGDADPGYPGLVNGQVVGQTKHEAQSPRMSAVRVSTPLVQGEAFNFPEPVGEAKTRAQVRAETLEAIRVGAISNSDRYEFPTAQQLESIRVAGLRALDPTMAATRTTATAN